MARYFIGIVPGHILIYQLDAEYKLCLVKEVIFNGLVVNVCAINNKIMLITDMAVQIYSSESFELETEISFGLSIVIAKTVTDQAQKEKVGLVLKYQARSLFILIDDKAVISKIEFNDAVANVLTDNRGYF